MPPFVALEHPILLADVDAMYASTYRSLFDPDGRRWPFLLVGGDLGRRGVVASASYECRRFGIRAGDSMDRAVKVCPKAKVVPVPWEAVTEKSRIIREVCREFAPTIEPFSVDEVYLDFHGTTAIYGDEPLASIAARLRETIRARTGLTVSIGGAFGSKQVAKMASDFAKPHKGNPTGVYIVAPGEELAFMRRVGDLAEIPFVGPRFQERLRKFGLTTVDQVLALDHATIVQLFGAREGQWLYERVRGIDPSPVEPRGPAKSISRDATFATDVFEDVDFERALSDLVAEAGADLRADHLSARTITVRLRDADWTDRQKSRTVPEPISSDRAIQAVARELLHELRRVRRVRARLLGVGLSSFGVATQLTIFDQDPAAQREAALIAADLETERDRALSRAMDAVRQKYGASAIGPAGRPTRDGGASDRPSEAAPEGAKSGDPKCT